MNDDQWRHAALEAVAGPGPGPGSESESQSERVVVLHYHLFKNAGTSVDAILKRNFGQHWLNREFPPPAACDHAAAILALIEENPGLRAISSHTLLVRPPATPGLATVPLIFIRHPLQRLASAYAFERRQAADTFGAQLAKETDLAGYTRGRLATRGDRALRNFQALRLAALSPLDQGSERERALLALDTLPFVGLVEAFDASMRAMQAVVAAHYPDFQTFHAHENVTKDAPGAGSQDVEALLGSDLFDEFIAANQLDLEIYRLVEARYAAAAAGEPRP